MHCVVIMKHKNIFQIWTSGSTMVHEVLKQSIHTSINLSHNIGNYKNISLTLAKHHQLMTCYSNLDSTSFI